MRFSDTITDETSALHFKESLANLFNIYNKDGISSFNINRTVVIDIPEEVEKSYVIYKTAHENEFWTNISYKEYGTIRYWWLVCKINKVVNPTIGPKEGQIIKILAREYVDEIVKSIQIQ